eukprot:1161938-Pelagomonas_calceolata.AAC.1
MENVTPPKFSEPAGALRASANWLWAIIGYGVTWARAVNCRGLLEATFACALKWLWYLDSNMCMCPQMAVAVNAIHRGRTDAGGKCLCVMVARGKGVCTVNAMMRGSKLQGAKICTKNAEKQALSGISHSQRGRGVCASLWALPLAHHWRRCRGARITERAAS